MQRRKAVLSQKEERNAHETSGEARKVKSRMVYNICARQNFTWRATRGGVPIRIELRRRCRSHLPTGPSLSIVESKSNKPINKKITSWMGKTWRRARTKAQQHHKSGREDCNGNYTKKTPQNTETTGKS